MTKRELATLFCRVYGGAMLLSSFLAILEQVLVFIAGSQQVLKSQSVALIVLRILIYGALFFLSEPVAAQMTGDVWRQDREPIREAAQWKSVGLSCFGLIVLINAALALALSAVTLCYFWDQISGSSGFSIIAVLYGGPLGVGAAIGGPILQASLGFYLAFARNWLANAKRRVSAPQTPPNDEI